MPMPALNLKNKRFVRLIALERDPLIGKAVYWKCKCDCGNFTEVAASNLKNRSVKSCGCLKEEGTHFTHGMSKTPIYNIWCTMKQRCDKPNAPGYKNYGGRGIKYCESWKKFENFYKDMGDIPKGMSLERKNNNGDYTPENCIWDSRVHQMNNMRRNRLITFNGQTKTLMQWARLTGLDRKTISDRIDRYGWSVEDALSHSRNLDCA